MRVLLDTHVLLWVLAEPGRLPDWARTLIESPETEVLFSAVSIWEIAIKSQLLRQAFGVDAATIAEVARGPGFLELPVTSSHAARVARLEMHHRDPFDRLLVSQAIDEPARLLTADKTLQAYARELVELI